MEADVGVVTHVRIIFISRLVTLFSDMLETK